MTNIHRTREELHLYVKNSYGVLSQLGQQHNREEFNRLMARILPGVKTYIASRFGTAVRNEQLSPTKYKVDDFVDELFIKAYDHIQEVKSDKDFHAWLFHEADQLLEDVIIEEEFDHTFFENIDKYSQLEWDEMEEKFSTDGDGDLVMEDELDDLSYPKYDYVLADVFTEDKSDELLEKLNRELSPRDIHYHIDFTLQRIPATIANIFVLAVSQGFSPEEIALIKKVTIKEVKSHLSEARKLIQLSFKKRFDNDEVV